MALKKSDFRVAFYEHTWDAANSRYVVAESTSFGCDTWPLAASKTRAMDILYALAKLAPGHYEVSNDEASETYEYAFHDSGLGGHMGQAQPALNFNDETQVDSLGSAAKGVVVNPVHQGTAYLLVLDGGLEHWDGVSAFPPIPSTGYTEIVVEEIVDREWVRVSP